MAIQNHIYSIVMSSAFHDFITLKKEVLLKFGDCIGIGVIGLCRDACILSHRASLFYFAMLRIRARAPHPYAEGL